ncbi:hypothetical protein [Xenorhabdus bharatensis]|uniref:hypothetical protein n=1 Tax=Xenorhabdus bharatensis TaxID=3136256 RepID=UPI0030F43EB3
MITMDQADKINSATRGYFWWGHKSNNKVYLLNYGNAHHVKKTIRNAHALEATEFILKKRASSQLTFAEHLNIPFDEHAGNCGEYTEHAVNRALTTDSVSTVWTFGCREAEGVDHIFCVFNLLQAPSNTPCLERMSSENSYPDVIVCDPWANIVCLYAEYPERLREKMKTWNGLGKSILVGISAISAMSAIEWGNRCLAAPADFEQKY